MLTEKGRKVISSLLEWNETAFSVDTMTYALSPAHSHISKGLQVYGSLYVQVMMRVVNLSWIRETREMLQGQQGDMIQVADWHVYILLGP